MNKSFSEIYNTWYNLDKVDLSRKVYYEKQKEIDRLNEVIKLLTPQQTKNYLKENLDE